MDVGGGSIRASLAEFAIRFGLESAIVDLLLTAHLDLILS
jgi:hypothetical protein